MASPGRVPAQGRFIALLILLVVLFMLVAGIIAAARIASISPAPTATPGEPSASALVIVI